MNILKKQPQTIMITGASRGIGLVTARLLAKQGGKNCNLALFSNELIETILEDKTLAKAHKAGRLTYGIMDVANPDDWDNAIEQTVSAFGGVDVLINNAGILMAGNLADSQLEQQFATIDVNCKGVLTGCQKLAKYLKQSPQGKIINLSSASAIYGQPEIATYSATKFFVRGLTEALNIEYAKDNIKVVDIMPLWVVTDLTKHNSATSMNRLGVRLTPIDVAKAIAKLVNKPNKKICKVHYAVGMPAKILGGVAQVTPDAIVRFINKQLAT